MRLALLLLLVPSLAYAEEIGVNFDEGIGGASYRGELATMGSGGPRLQLALNVRRGPWTVSVLGGGVMPDFFFIDCYGEECDVPPSASYSYGGVDLKRAWPLVHSRHRHGGLQMFLHGGPRWYEGDQAIKGYAGPGLSAGAGIEAHAIVVGGYVDFGIDAFRLTSHMDVLHGSSPYVMLGIRLGLM
jgi:hypothetical protein